jgi:hypothetical protein
MRVTALSEPSARWPLHSRVGNVDIPKLADQVAEDTEIARRWKHQAGGK